MFDPESMVLFVQISFEMVNSCHRTPLCTCIIEWKWADDYNPAGRLPVTFYKSESQLSDFEEYAMQGRTYRFFSGEPLFSFGHGLSYTQFEYTDFNLPDIASFAEPLNVSVKVTNTGQLAGDEVVQFYVKDIEA